MTFGSAYSSARASSRFFGDAAQLGGVLEVVGGDELGEVVEGDRLRAAGVAGVLGRLLQRMLGPKAVADVGVAQPERGVLVDEVAVDPVRLDDVVGDVVEDRQVGLRREGELDVGQLVGAMLEGRQHRDLDVLAAQPPVGDPGPEDGVHLRHVRAPEHERVGGLDVVVAAHRLVHAEGAHEAHGRRGHAVPGVGIEVVGAEPGLQQLQRRVAFPHRPLPRAEHADRGRTLVLEDALELLRHHVEGRVPGHALELAVLRVLAVLHAQQRRRQAVLAVHDLGEEVALDAVQALVDLGLGIAVRGDDPVVLHRHRHAAAGAAEAARRLRPLQLGGLGVRGGGRLRQPGHGNAGHGAGGGRRRGANEVPTVKRHRRPPLSSLPAPRRAGRPGPRKARRRVRWMPFTRASISSRCPHRG